MINMSNINKYSQIDDFIKYIIIEMESFIMPLIQYFYYLKNNESSKLLNSRWTWTWLFNSWTCFSRANRVSFQELFQIS